MGPLAGTEFYKDQQVMHTVQTHTHTHQDKELKSHRGGAFAMEV